jgi:hypothetical protein
VLVRLLGPTADTGFVLALAAVDGLMLLTEHDLAGIGERGCSHQLVVRAVLLGLVLVHLLVVLETTQDLHVLLLVGG